MGNTKSASVDLHKLASNVVTKDTQGGCLVYDNDIWAEYSIWDHLKNQDARYLDK